MTNKEIASHLKLLAQLMELLNGNPFKIKSYTNAAFAISKSSDSLSLKTLQELESTQGFGKSMAAKIFELNQTGSIEELNLLTQSIPSGIIDILKIKGLGPKKVLQIWKELEIESVGELYYACLESRLKDIKGFGEKTQAEVIKEIEFIQSNKGLHHFAGVEQYGKNLIEKIIEVKIFEKITSIGKFARKHEIIDCIELCTLCLTPFEKDIFSKELNFTFVDEYKNHLDFDVIEFITSENIIVKLTSTYNIEDYSKLSFIFSFDTIYWPDIWIKIKDKSFITEADFFNAINIPYIPVIAREAENNLFDNNVSTPLNLISVEHLKGILHWHTSYSDGKNTLKEMVMHAKELGYAYVGVCDHSQSAFYANGLKEDRILKQHNEIDLLNKELSPFKIFKGIESDILNNGSLDYTEDILKQFDFIVASVHSNLKMSKEKATERILAAVENKYTTILGHPTGRLLLSRNGYELDWDVILKACAKNNVVIELNAHPYRLDIDWRLLNKAISYGCKISINPDAHELKGFNDMRYGVYAAQKALVDKQHVLNTLNLYDFELFLESKK